MKNSRKRIVKIKPQNLPMPKKIFAYRKFRFSISMTSLLNVPREGNYDTTEGYSSNYLYASNGTSEFCKMCGSLRETLARSSGSSNICRRPLTVA